VHMHFADNEGGQFLRTSFMEGPLAKMTKASQKYADELPFELR